MEYDVIVAGGGSAGVAAAIGARRAGARVLLVERGPCLGGAATLRNVLTYCGIYDQASPPRQVVHGVAEEVLAALREVGAVTQPQAFTATAVVFDPESVKRVLDDLCVRAGVDVLMHSQIVAAERSGHEVAAVRVASHGGIRRLAARAFVDATGDADLASFAGAAVRYGNDGVVQNASLGVRLGGIPATVGLSKAEVQDAVLRAERAGVETLTSKRGLVARLPISGDVITYLVDEAYDARDPVSVSRAEASARRQAAAYLEVFRSYLGCPDAYIVSTGPEIGTRESRHVIARYRLTDADVLSGVRFDDAIAHGAWPIEYHPAPGVAPEWEFILGGASFDIPLRSLISVDTVNLLAAGRAIDADRGAGASVRVMGTAFATGHAAGVAAARLVGTGGIEPVGVRSELDRQGARLRSGAPDALPVPTPN